MCFLGVKSKSRVAGFMFVGFGAGIGACFLLVREQPKMLLDPLSATPGRLYHVQAVLRPLHRLLALHAVQTVRDVFPGAPDPLPLHPVADWIVLLAAAALEEEPVSFFLAVLTGIALCWLSGKVKVPEVFLLGL